MNRRPPDHPEPGRGADGERAVLATIAGMPETYRTMGERLHALVRERAPVLSPRLWYGMPAYARDGRVVCFFRGAARERYMTIGFNEEAHLDDGAIWPVAYALAELTPDAEARIGELVARAVS